MLISRPAAHDKMRSPNRRPIEREMTLESLSSMKATPFQIVPFKHDVQYFCHSDISCFFFYYSIGFLFALGSDFLLVIKCPRDILLQPSSIGLLSKLLEKNLGSSAAPLVICIFSSPLSSFLFHTAGRDGHSAQGVVSPQSSGQLHQPDAGGQRARGSREHRREEESQQGIAHTAQIWSIHHNETRGHFNIRN